MVTITFFDYNDDRFNIVSSIRTSVFTNEQGADAKNEFDEYDKDSIFALLYDGDDAVGTARISKTDKGYKIGRIAILSVCRGKGFGDAIVRATVNKAFSICEDNEIFVDAQNYAIPFYEKIGFKIIGGEIIDRGLPHTQMSIKRENFYGKKKCEG